PRRARVLAGPDAGAVQGAGGEAQAADAPGPGPARAGAADLHRHRERVLLRRRGVPHRQPVRRLRPGAGRGGRHRPPADGPTVAATASPPSSPGWPPRPPPPSPTSTASAPPASAATWTPTWSWA